MESGSSSKTIVFLLFLLLTCNAIAAEPNHIVTNGPEERAANYFESVRLQPAALREFLRAMPKGGDLHNHLSGAVYPEHYIQWAAEDNFCIDRKTLAYEAPPCASRANVIPASEVLKDRVLDQRMLRALSMRSFEGPGSAHDHFFATFAKFEAVAKRHMGDMLAAVMSDAAANHVSYLELILDPVHGEADRFVTDRGLTFSGDAAAERTKLLQDGLNGVVADGRRNFDEAEARMRQVLHCGTLQAMPGCAVTVRYQYEVHRALTPEIVYAEMVTGFELAKADPRVVAVNPVMPEDSPASVRNFDELMRMFAYLHGVYPKVHLSLHAGELWKGLVPASALRDHIRESVEIAHAERIGHGVDITLEENYPSLLREMAARRIAVEVNLTSNDEILGIRGKEHPLPLYRRFGVPVVLGTDDPGVGNSDMSREYMLAVREFDLSYSDLKQIVRNSLEFSFLQGGSLWTDSTYTRQVPECSKTSAAEKPDSTCAHYLAANPRARLQWQLEKDFYRFESETCCTLGTAARPVSRHSVR